MNRKKNLFFDCDGTLFPWKRLPEEDRWRLYTQEYYESLAAYPQMKTLVRDLAERAPLYICSVCLGKDARKGKDRALDLQYGKHCFPRSRRFYVPEGMSKAEYAMKRLGRNLDRNDLLLDDHSANLIDWEAHGGTSVKVLNGFNGSGRTWKGMRMTLDGKIIISGTGNRWNLDQETIDSLVFRVYEQAVRDYLQLTGDSSLKAERERSEIVQFLKDDRFHFGTGKILKRLGIA